MKETIESFISQKELAIAGVSSDSRKWGNVLSREFVKKGYKIYPVNPKLDEAEGTKCYRSVRDLPASIENLVISTSAANTLDILRDCKNTGIKRVWMIKGGIKSGSQLEDAISFAKENNIDLVHSLCPMMFFSPSGIHKFHFWIKKVMKTFPDELQMAN